MESTNELVTAAEARAEGLSLDGVANNRCITKQQFNDNLPSGGGIADAIDLLNGSLNGSTLIFFNNTTTDTTMGISIINMYGQSTSATRYSCFIHGGIPYSRCYKKCSFVWQ